MPDAGFWRPTVIRLRRVDSTQDWVRDWAQMGAREGLILIAREQIAGRGRLDHRWESPPGGLYLSLLLRPAISLTQVNQLIMLVSLAAIDACQAVAGVKARPKWPNDLLLDGKKLAGALTELAGARRPDYVVIGLGLNVNNDFTGGPLAESAISLRASAGRRFDVDDVATAFIRAFGRRYAVFLRGESPHRAWAENLEPLGRRVAVHRIHHPPLLGVAEDVSPEGALLVRDDAGELHTVWAGDVVIA
jgi:BirA family biotin operon repressor/biotin-[acetyl-CoA-carboxylase] ligase